MNEYRALAVVAGLLTYIPSAVYAQSSPYDDILQQLATLSERVTKLEAANAALLRQNEDMQRRIAVQPAAPAVPASAQPPATPDPNRTPPWYESFKVSGYLFGDAYAVAGHHDPAIEDQNGFWIRRSYLTLDAQVADEWSARLRFEANSPGDFETNSKLDPFIKDAYLRWTRGASDLYLGLAPSPTFEFIEGFWGYRQLEKTPLDLYRVGSSRDLGVAFKGKLADGRVFYHAMLGNGAGDGAETNAGKKIMSSLGFRPSESLAAELYLDYEDRPGATDRATYQAFLGWSGERSRYGLQYAAQDREQEGAGDDTVAVASAFGTWQLTDHGTLIARYDRSFDGYEDADRIAYFQFATDTPFDLAILAWEQKLELQISLMPTLEYVHYRSANGLPPPDDDLYAKLTLFYQF